MSETIRDKASATYEEAKAKASETAANAKARAEKAAAATKAKAKSAASATRSSAKKAASKTSEGLDRNPLSALVGGLAVGAIVAALLPRTKREDQMVGSVGKTVRSTANKAVKTATDTAKEQLDALGVNADTAKGQLRDLVTKLGEAAASAGSAAADTVKKRK